MTTYAAANLVPMTALPTTAGIVQNFLVNTTNTGSSTFAPDDLAEAPILALAGTSLQGGEMIAGGIATLVSYIGPLLNNGDLCWILFDCTGGALQVAAATCSGHAIQAGLVVSGSFQTATAGGTANSITASFPLSPIVFANGQSFTIVSSVTNTGAMTATITLGGVVQSAVSIVKGNNQALATGDFPAGYPGDFCYSAIFGCLVMRNPAGNFSTSGGVKAYVNFVGSTGAIVGTPFNVSSVTRNSIGNWTVHFSETFSNANFPYSISYLGNAGIGQTCGKISSTASSISVFGATNGIGSVDLTELSVTIFGT